MTKAIGQFGVEPSRKQRGLSHITAKVGGSVHPDPVFISDGNYVLMCEVLSWREGTGTFFHVRRFRSSGKPFSPPETGQYLVCVPQRGICHGANDHLRGCLQGPVLSFLICHSISF